MTTSPELLYTENEPPLCWKEVFGTVAPVELEIGFGKCGFLLQLAAANPAHNLIGLEASLKYYRKGIRKIQRAGVPNVKLLWGRAIDVVQHYIPDHSLTTVYINFPDPWPKNRHAKRRLVQAPFVALLAHKLIPDGCVDIATDAAAYMQQIQDVFRVHATDYFTIYECTSTQKQTVRPYTSDYEDMYLKEGKTIYYAKYQRRWR